MQQNEKALQCRVAHHIIHLLSLSITFSVDLVISDPNPSIVPATEEGLLPHLPAHHSPFTSVDLSPCQSPPHTTHNALFSYAYLFTSTFFYFSTWKKWVLGTNRIPGLQITLMWLEVVWHSDVHFYKLKLNSKFSKFSSKCCQHKNK